MKNNMGVFLWQMHMIAFHQKIMEELPKVVGDGESWMIHEDLEFRSHTYPAMLSASKADAQKRAEEIIATSLTAMQKEMGEESRRLKELQSKNYHVRPEEIAALENRKEEFEEAITKARIRLDSIRLIIASDGSGR
jgi:hypothetical protein